MLAPRAIHDRLVTFAGAVRERRYRDAATEYQVVINLHHAMATAARTWQRSLAHALSGGPDPDKQDVLWRTLHSYIGMWGEQVDVHSPRIAALMTELAPMLTEPVWRACCRAALEDAADRHSGHVAGRIAEARQALRLTWRYAQAFQEEANKLVDQPMTRHEFGQFARRLFPLPADAGQLARRNHDQAMRQLADLFGAADTTAEIRGTRWAAYNAVTEYLDKRAVLHQMQHWA